MKRTGILSGYKKFTMDVERKANDVQLETDRQRSNYGNFMDDEEVTLLHHKRDMDVPNNPGSDVREEPDTSDTQREDWLLQTEPLHGARPRRTKTERPPSIDDHTGIMDLEAAGGTGPEGGATWNPGPSAATRAADLGRGGHYTTKGSTSGSRAQMPPGWARAVPRIFTEVRPRDGGPDRQKDVGSPVEMLVNTIAQMQLDLVDLRAENRMLRPPGVPQVVRAPQQATIYGH